MRSISNSYGNLVTVVVVVVVVVVAEGNKVWLWWSNEAGEKRPGEPVSTGEAGEPFRH